MNSKRCFIFALLAGAALTSAAAAGLPFVSPMFGNNMILQQGKTNAIWVGPNPARLSAWNSLAKAPPPWRALMAAGKCDSYRDVHG